ncbi:MAG: hypothetical protein IT189_06650 [Microbacteriaceae bacterium]|jgi:hypothetical protein|nr:hypothetical protein [Microbacteriaceae bacterium]
MQKKTKIAAGSAAALAILVAGGLAVALPAQASPVAKTVSVVEPVDATDTDNVQNEVEDGAANNEGTEAAGTEVEDGANDSETADETGAEDTSDDVGGVPVEDGTQD